MIEGFVGLLGRVVVDRIKISRAGAFVCLNSVVAFVIKI